MSMTVLSTHYFNLSGQFGILVDGRQSALFGRLVSGLALISVCVWSLVAVCTLICVLAQQVYRFKVRVEMRRKLAIEIE